MHACVHCVHAWYVCMHLSIHVFVYVHAWTRFSMVACMVAWFCSLTVLGGLGFTWPKFMKRFFLISTPFALNLNLYACNHTTICTSFV